MDSFQFQRLLVSLEGQPGSEYRRLEGVYQYDDFTLRVEYIPEIPDLYPCRLRAAVPLTTAKFPRDVFTPKSRGTAACDFLTRQFNSNAGPASYTMKGIIGGMFDIEHPGQELIETNAVVLGEDVLEARFSLALPLIRKRIPTEMLAELFMKRVPALIRRSLTYEGIDRVGLLRWIEVNEDADTLRSMLADRGLVAFIADGSLLAWKGPLERRDVVPVVSPEELAVTFTLPNRGTIRGMGIPKGITAIAGGWRQGKTTFLRALGLGVYNHIPGDGREFALTASDAVLIRAEDGRRVERVDISPLLPPDPGVKPGTPVSSTSAGPTVSFAANLMEALEIGTSLLLFDDEGTAVPVAGRDPVSRALIRSESAPRTLPDILPILRDRHGISSIVVGSSDELFAVADRIILFDRFRPAEVTANVKEMVRKTGCAPAPEPAGTFSLPKRRTPLSRSLEPPKRERKFPMPQGRDIVQYGDEYIDLSGLHQLASKAQVRSIGRAIVLVDKLLDGSPSLVDAIGKVMARISSVGLDTLSNKQMGDLALFRPQELAGAINRMKQLKIK